MEAKLHVDLSDDTLNQLMEKAILEQMSPDTRERLIQQSVKALLTKSIDRGDGKSPLQAAFDRAVERACYTYAQEKLAENTEFAQQLGELFEAAWKRVTQNEDARENIIDGIANGMRRVITGDRY